MPRLNAKSKLKNKNKKKKKQKIVSKKPKKEIEEIKQDQYEEELDIFDDERRVNPKNDECELCDRMMPLTFHHLIPKETHDKYLKLHPTIPRLWLHKHGTWICRQCHSAVHDLYTNDELMEDYWTVDLLLESDKIQKWIKFARKQKRSKNDHKDSRGMRGNRISSIRNNGMDKSTKFKYIR